MTKPSGNGTHEPGTRLAWAPVGSFVILSIAALKLASVIAVPVVVSVLLTLLLQSPVAWLKRHRIPEYLGAGLLVFGTVTAFIVALAFLAEPAGKWAADVPRHFDRIEARLHRLSPPLSSIQKSVAKVDSAAAAGSNPDAQVVKLAEPGMLNRISGTGARIGGQALEVLFLSFFLLAAAPLFRRKLVAVWPGRRERKEVEEVIQEIEGHMSHYLWMSTVMNLGVALLTWGLLAVVGFPNPLLWGVLAGVVNYVPYAGPLALSIILAAAGAISSLKPGPIVIVVMGYLLIHGLQSNLVAPAVLEKKLPLNPAALFLGLMFFGWLWGVPGAILAVPLTVMIQVVCARIPAMEDVAVLLDS